MYGLSKMTTRIDTSHDAHNFSFFSQVSSDRELSLNMEPFKLSIALATSFLLAKRADPLPFFHTAAASHLMPCCDRCFSNALLSLSSSGPLPMPVGRPLIKMLFSGETRFLSTFFGLLPFPPPFFLPPM